MKPLTLEWIKKAEEDFISAGRELRARRDPNYDDVCFHAQQTAEKYLKAVLQENETDYPKTHQLMDLLALCLEVDSSFQLIYTDLLVLEDYAVKYRYPGNSADKLEAKTAFKSIGTIREFVRFRLGLV